MNTATISESTKTISAINWVKGFMASLTFGRTRVLLSAPQMLRLPHAQRVREKQTVKKSLWKRNTLGSQAYSQPMSIPALGYTLHYSPPSDCTVCLDHSGLHFELARRSGNKANGSNAQSITGWWCGKTYLQTNIWSNIWRHDFRCIVAGWKLSLPHPPELPLPPRRILPLVSTAQTTSAILQTPNSFFFLLGEKQDTPPPFSKKPPPTGLAGYNGPPKECFPLHALSPPPMAEQRERQRGETERGYIPLCSVPSLAVCLTDWFVV